MPGLDNAGGGLRRVRGRAPAGCRRRMKARARTDGQSLGARVTRKSHTSDSEGAFDASPARTGPSDARSGRPRLWHRVCPKVLARALVLLRHPAGTDSVGFRSPGTRLLPSLLPFLPPFPLFHPSLSLLHPVPLSLPPCPSLPSSSCLSIPPSLTHSLTHSQQVGETPSRATRICKNRNES